MSWVDISITSTGDSFLQQIKCLTNYLRKIKKNYDLIDKRQRLQQNSDIRKTQLEYVQEVVYEYTTEHGLTNLQHLYLAVDSKNTTTQTNPNILSSSINLNVNSFSYQSFDNSKLINSVEVHDKSMGCEFMAAMITTDEVDDMPNQLRYSIANHFKIKGNYHYKQTQFNDAISLYMQALSITDFIVPENDDEDELKHDTISATLNINIANCYYQKGNYKDCKQYSEAAINYDPNNQKAKYWYDKSIKALRARFEDKR